MSTTGPGTSAPRAILGLALLAPAALCCAFGLLVPTLRTFTLSFQEANLLRPGQPVGMANYSALFSDPVFRGALGFTLSMIVVRVLVVAVVPLLLAFAASRVGRAPRVLTRLMFSVPLALFAPVSIAVVWSMALDPRFGLFRNLLGGEGRPLLADVARVRPTLLFIDGLYTFGLACGLGLIFYLAALRGGSESPGGRNRAVLVTWMAGLLATIALTLQSFTLSYVLTAGGPANATRTLTLYQYNQAFQFFRFGPAAATATVVLVPVVAMGLVAGLLIIFSGLRLQLVPSRVPRPAGGSGIMPVVLLLLLLLGVGCGALGLAPLAWNALNSLKSNAEVLIAPAPLLPPNPSLDAYQQLEQQASFGRARLNSIAPSLAAVLLIQLPLAYFGALGIGALRPLGRRSEWLLLPFSPWLFVTIAPLSLGAFETLRGANALNTVAGLIPPILISVPVLFILVLFFKGQEPRWRAAQEEGQAAAGAFVRTLIMPSLPLAGLLACVLLLAASRSLLWPLLSLNSRELFTANVAMVVLRGTFATEWPLLAAAVTAFELPLTVVFFLIFGVAQVLYLERLALVAGPAPIEAARDYSTRRLDV